jgi:hypothetical protein
MTHAPVSPRPAPTPRAALAAVAFAAAALAMPAVCAAEAGEAGEADYAAARALLDEHRDDPARAKLLDAARAGHPRAAATLGMMALLSPSWAGDERPEVFARRWLGAASIAGDASAIHVLATMNAGTVKVARRGNLR